MKNNYGQITIDLSYLSLPDIGENVSIKSNLYSNDLKILEILKKCTIERKPFTKQLNVLIGAVSNLLKVDLFLADDTTEFNFRFLYDGVMYIIRCPIVDSEIDDVLYDAYEIV